MRIRDDIDKLGASSSDTAKGQCAKCGDENPYSSIACSGCGARLPWADAVSDKARANASTHAPLSIASARHGEPAARCLWAGIGARFRRLAWLSHSDNRDRAAHRGRADRRGGRGAQLCLSLPDGAAHAYRGAASSQLGSRRSFLGAHLPGSRASSPASSRGSGSSSPSTCTAWGHARHGGRGTILQGVVPLRRAARWY